MSRSTKLTVSPDQRLSLATKLRDSARDLPPDLTLVCQDGESVQTHWSLMGLFSMFLREVMSSSSLYISIPDVTKSDMEKIIALLSWENQDWILGSTQIEAAKLLGIPVGEPEKIVPYTVMASSSYSTFNLNDAKTEDKIGANEVKCVHCHNLFDYHPDGSVDEIQVHLAEVHFEPTLNSEHKNMFEITNQCKKCDVEIEDNYVQKEHIILNHPWPLLLVTVEDIINKSKDKQSKKKNKECSTQDSVPTSVETDFFYSFPDSSSMDRNRTINTIVQRFFPKMNEKSLETNLKETKAIFDKPVGETDILPKRTLNCVYCPQNWINSSKTRIGDLKYRIKIHLSFHHYGPQLTEYHQEHFHTKNNKCGLCFVEVKGNTEIQKRHLIVVHKLLDPVTLSHIDSILGNVKKDNADSDNRTKGNEIKTSGAKRKAKDAPKGRLPKKVKDKRRKQSTYQEDKSCDIDLIQNNIEFSDSDSDEDYDKVQRRLVGFQKIQDNIEYSDSDSEIDYDKVQRRLVGFQFRQ